MGRLIISIRSSRFTLKLKVHLEIMDQVRILKLKMAIVSNVPRVLLGFIPSASFLPAQHLQSECQQYTWWRDTPTRLHTCAPAIQLENVTRCSYLRLVTRHRLDL